MNYTKYDPVVLKHLQDVLLMMLKDISEICEENNIKYYAYAGTTLGAVRHKGFIPWDDDVDLIMLPEDYEKFRNVIKLYSDKYEFITIENTDDYFLLFSKVMLKGTNFDEWWANQVNFPTGIFIDIFPIYKVPKNQYKRWIHLKLVRILNHLISISILKYKGYPIWIEIITNCIHYLFKILHITPNFLKRCCLKLLKKYQNSNSGVYSEVTGRFKPNIFYKNELNQSKLMKFEDIRIPVQNDFDRFLTEYYGDYMKLPPKDKRYNHQTGKISFGEY